MTPEQVEQMTVMREAGATWSDIGRAFGVSRDRVKRALVKGHAEKRAEIARRWRRKWAQPNYVNMVISEKRSELNPIYDPRRDAGRVYRSAFSELLGEPPIGFSALDKRGQNGSSTQV